jgi:putative peptidoglycan lipid II flippase
MNQRKGLGTLAMVFVGVFIYAIVAMVVSRELVIPRMTLSIDGHIEGDPQYYHLLALKKVDEIRSGGVRQFELRPEGQGPAGVASLLYLVTGSTYGMVVLNATMHALATIMMVLILMQWFSRCISIIASLPLALSPYMIVWFSQINKDSFVLLGVMLFTYGLLNLLNPKARVPFYKEALLYLLVALFGMVLIWIMRPYVNQILLPITSLILVVVLVLRSRKPANGTWIGLVLYGGAMLVSLGLLSKGATSDETLDSFKYFKLQGQSQTLSTKCLSTIDGRNWRNEPYLPDFLNEKLKAMMGQRCNIFTLLETQSNVTTRESIVDMDRFPSGSSEALAYLPRAALLGVFSPWPDRWGYVFYKKPSVFYTITPVEAILLYIGFASLVAWLVWNKAWSVSIPIVLCITVMTIYGMATPFLGALYRYRYPWWILLICLGVAALLTLVGNLRSKLQA